MCSYCGCQALPVIRLLTIQHEQVINKLGEIRRSSEASATEKCQEFARDLAELLAVHNKLEEEGLFNALQADQDFGETIVKLRQEHDEIDGLVARIISGEIDLVMELERLLRDNISNEENGLFPASAVTLDGGTWDRIEAQQGFPSVSWENEGV
jgi:hemerythrin superfamily protein